MKILDFIKSKYKILIPIMVVFVLLVTVYFFYREYKYDNYRNKEEVAVYQHFNSLLIEYNAQIVYNLKDVLVDFTPINRNVAFEVTPIYYKDSDKVIFPQDMNIVFPVTNGVQYKLYKYATYLNDNGTHKIKNSDYLNNYDLFFLYNGDDLFFFPDEVTLNMDGKEYVKLGKMSFVRLVDGYTLEFYDKENDKADFIEVEGKEITVTNDYMDVNLSRKYLKKYDSKILLFSPDSLKSLSN